MNKFYYTLSNIPTISQQGWTPDMDFTYVRNQSQDFNHEVSPTLPQMRATLYKSEMDEGKNALGSVENTTIFPGLNFMKHFNINSVHQRTPGISNFGSSRPLAL